MSEMARLCQLFRHTEPKSVKLSHKRVFTLRNAQSRKCALSDSPVNDRQRFEDWIGRYEGILRV